jgi:hypothetical protein
MIVTTPDTRCPVCHRQLHPAEDQLFGIHVRCLTPRLELPRSTEQEFIEFLGLKPGHPYCALCVADILRISHDEATTIARTLSHSPSFRVSFDQCSLCEQRRVTIAATGPRTGSPRPPRATS